MTDLRFGNTKYCMSEGVNVGWITCNGLLAFSKNISKPTHIYTHTLFTAPAL